MGKTTQSVTTNDDHLPHHSTRRLVTVAAASPLQLTREETLLILYLRSGCLHTTNRTEGKRDVAVHQKLAIHYSPLFIYIHKPFIAVAKTFLYHRRLLFCIWCGRALTILSISCLDLSYRLEVWVQWKEGKFRMKYGKR